MGTITPRKRKDGTTGYRVMIRLKRDGRVIHKETQTFDRHQAASAWMKRRETELAEPGAIEKAATPDPILAEAIDRYLESSEKAIGRTKAQVLRSIKRHEIAGRPCSTITSAEVVAFLRQLAHVGPSTRMNYLSHLAAVFSVCRPAWGYQLDQQAIRDAAVVCRRMGITRKSRGRDRRPTIEEMDSLMEHFGAIRARRKDSIPMQAITAFALFSSRRQEEITRIRWEDLDGDRIMIRDMKNPGDKEGNNQWCDLPEEARAIIEAQPRVKDCIFPYSTDAIGAAFTRACKTLGIDDLHFHDLRHEGASRLFEMGWSIPQVASVTGHRSWSSLKGYTHLRQTGDKWKGWPWLAVVSGSKG